MKGHLTISILLMLWSKFLYAAPHINQVMPNPMVGSWLKQSLSIQGKDIKKNSRVRLCWPKRCITLAGTRIKFKNSEEMIVNISTGLRSENWQVAILDPDGTSSNIVDLNVRLKSKKKRKIESEIIKGKKKLQLSSAILSYKRTVSHMLMLDKSIATLTGAEGSLINYPSAIDVQGDNIFFADGIQHLFFRYNYREKIIYQLYETSNQIDAPIGSIYVKNDLSYFVADKRGSRVLYFNKEGDLIREFIDLKNMRSPTSVMFDEKSNTLFVADSVFDRVLLFNANGIATGTISRRGTGDSQLMRVVDISLGPDGLYIVDELNSLIKVFSLTGNFLYGIPRPEVVNPSSLTVDDLGRIYVSDRGDDTIKIFDRSGFIESYGGVGSKNGQFRSIEDLDADQNKLYIADSGNNRIQILDINFKKNRGHVAK